MAKQDCSKNVCKDLPTFRELAKKPDSPYRTVIRKEKVYGRDYTFYDTYKGDKLVEIQ